MNVNDMMAWESGDLNPKETLELFSTLIKEGTIHSLQGVYGRQAQSFINQNWINKSGEVNYNKLAEYDSSYRKK